MRARRGMALVVVLIVVAVLELLVAELAHYAALSRKAARNYARDVQARAAVDGAVRAVGPLLADPHVPPEQIEDLVLRGIPPFSLGESVCTVGLEDECGKLNVGVLADEELGERAEAELAALCGALGLRPDVARAIAEHVRASGRPPAAIEELQGLGGLTHVDLFGSPGREGLAGCVTCWGHGRVNMNTAPEAVLEAVVGGVSGQLLEELLRVRSEGHVESIALVDGFRELGLEDQRYLVMRLSDESGAWTLHVAAATGDLTALTHVVVTRGSAAGYAVRLCRRLY